MFSGLKNSAFAVFWLFLLPVFALYLFHALYYGAWINDDAGISFTYARNLSNGYGLVLNPGGERVEGYSNPLWVFILSLFSLLGLFDPVVTPKTIGILSTFASFYLLFRISQHLFGSEKSLFHLAPPLLLSTNVSFVVWSISGLENGIYVLSILLAAYFYLKESDDSARRPFSGILFFMTAVARPEGILFFAAAFFHNLLTSILKKQAALRVLFWAGLFVIPFLIYHVWHYWYFASFFPNTYYAKLPVGNPLSRIWDTVLNFNSPGWIYVKTAFRDYHLRALLLPAIIILILYFRRSFQSIALILLFFGVTLFYPIYVGGDWMMLYRFLSPFFPLAYLFIGGALLGLWQLFTSLITNRTTRNNSFRIAGYSVASLVVFSMSTWLIYPNILYSMQVKKNPTVPFSHIVKYGERFNALAEKAFLQDASLLHPDLGGTSWVSRIKMLDLAGLADVHIARYHWYPKYFREYIFKEQKPTFIHTHCYWSIVTRVNYYPELRRDYVPLWENECRVPGYRGAINGEYVRKDVFVVSNPALNDKDAVARLNDVIELSKYDMDTDLTAPGNKIHITLYWKSLRLTDKRYRFSLALVDPNGQTFIRQEYPFVYGWYPVNRWKEGEIIKEEHDIVIPQEAPHGDYNIVATLIEGDTSSSNMIGNIIGQIEINREKALKKAEEYHSAYQNQIEKGDYEAALQLIKKGLILQPDNILYMEEFKSVRLKWVENYVKQAKNLFKHQEIEKATNILLEAKLVDKLNKDVLCTLSEIGDYYYDEGKDYLQKNDRKNAFRSFEMALRLDPSNSWARKRIEELRLLL